MRVTLLRNRPDAYTSKLKERGMRDIPSGMPFNAGRKAIAEGIFMPSDIKEAERMLDLFTSVGARDFHVTKTELEWKDHKIVKWGRSYTVKELRDKLPAMVRTAAIRREYELPDGQTIQAGENLIIRPTGPDVAFIQLDDLNHEQLEKVRPAAFLIHSTSPGNHQAWLAVSDAPYAKEPFKEFVRRVRKAVGGNDKSASHATRIAGVENFKLKYAPEFPMVSIVSGIPGRLTTSDKLREMGLLAEAEPAPSKPYLAAPHRVSPKTDRKWPSYAISLAGAPLNAEGTGPSRSHADFWWCKLAAQRGFTVEEIAAELLNVSEKARQRMNGDPGYVTTTARNGWAAYERDRLRSRGVG